jgi:hypothetical protein
VGQATTPPSAASGRPRSRISCLWENAAWEPT